MSGPAPPGPLILIGYELATVAVLLSGLAWVRLIASSRRPTIGRLLAGLLIAASLLALLRPALDIVRAAALFLRGDWGG